MREEGRTMSELLREALRIYMEQREWRRLERLERMNAIRGEKGEAERAGAGE